MLNPALTTQHVTSQPVNKDTSSSANTDKSHGIITTKSQTSNIPRKIIQLKPSRPLYVEGGRSGLYMSKNPSRMVCKSEKPSKNIGSHKTTLTSSGVLQGEYLVDVQRNNYKSIEPVLNRTNCGQQDVEDLADNEAEIIKQLYDFDLVDLRNKTVEQKKQTLIKDYSKYCSKLCGIDALSAGNNSPSSKEMDSKSQQQPSIIYTNSLLTTVNNTDLQNKPTENISQNDITEEKKIFRITSLLMDQTKLLLPKYSEHINIVLRPTLLNSQLINDIEDLDNLRESLEFFSTKLINEQKTTTEISAEQYEALITSYKVIGELVEDILNKKRIIEDKKLLKEAFSQYEKPGTTSSLKVKGQLGLDLHITSVNGGYEISSQISGCNDTKIRVFLSKKFTLSMIVGTNKLKGFASAAIGEADGKSFKNLDAFIDYYASKIILFMHKTNSNVKKSVQKSLKYDEHKKLLFSNTQLLNNALKTLNISDSEFENNLTYKSATKTPPLEIKRRIKENQLGIRVFQVAGFDMQSHNLHNTFLKKVPLIEQLGKHPEWLQEYTKNTFNMIIPDAYKDQCLSLLQPFYSDETLHKKNEQFLMGGNIIPLLSKRLSVIENLKLQTKNSSSTSSNDANIEKILSSFQQLARSLIIENYKQYEKYCQSINLSNADKLDTEIKKKEKTFLTYTEKLRNAKNQPDMLRMMMITHAYLTNIYKRATKQQENTQLDKSQWLDEITLDMSVPHIHISQKNYEKYLLLQQKTTGEVNLNEKVAKLAVGPLEGVVSVKDITTENDVNPNLNGKYLNVSFRGSIIGTASILESSVQGVVNKLMGTLPPIEGESPLLIDPLANVDTILEGMKHIKQEENYIQGKDGKYYLQYKRCLSGTELSAKTGIKAPIVGAANVSGQLAVNRQQYKHKSEDIGDNTISYLVTRYNGWMIGGEMDSWATFQNNNKTKLAKIMINMATEGKNANQEYTDCLKKIPNHNQSEINNNSLSNTNYTMINSLYPTKHTADQNESQSNITTDQDKSIHPSIALNWFSNFAALKDDYIKLQN